MRGNLYRMTFPNGKVYIGITNNIRRRINAHKRAAANRLDLPVSRAIYKFGWDSVKFERLLSGPYHSIRRLESHAIVFFNARVPNGYNVSEGGEIAPSMAPEVRAKIAKSNTGKKQTREQLNKQAESMRKRWGDSEYRDRVIKGATGLKRSEETKRKQSEARLGIKFSEEHKAKLSAARKGRLVHNWSPESRKKASESRKLMLSRKAVANGN